MQPLYWLTLAPMSSTSLQPFQLICVAPGLPTLIVSAQTKSLLVPAGRPASASGSLTSIPVMTHQSDAFVERSGGPR